VLGHRNRAPVDDLVARGATEVADLPALAAASDVVVLFLPGVKEVEALVTRLLPHLRPGMVVLDASTGLPETTRRLGALLAECDVDMVDAPVGRTPKEAEEGRLSSMIGGDPRRGGARPPDRGMLHRHHHSLRRAGFGADGEAGEQFRQLQQCRDHQ
jgi:3-hydroxyisobutyrate dehydrogenase-like beta-hydroxyacid dehydrogenase